MIIQELIQKEKELNIPEHRIVLAGFSQGGALALYTGLRFEKKLAAIISLSAYNPAEDSLNSAASSINAKTPILLAHGLFDPMVPLHMGKKALQQLTDLNYKVQWHDYPMQHTVSKQEIIDIGAFLRTVFELH